MRNRCLYIVYGIRGDKNEIGLLIYSIGGYLLFLKSDWKFL